MSMEWVSWLTALLVVTSVIAKIVSANLITRSKTELARLQAEVRKQRGVVESLVEHRTSLEDNVEFFVRRRVEDQDLHERLEADLEVYEASHRKHLEDLGHDPDDFDGEFDDELDEAETADAQTDAQTDGQTDDPASTQLSPGAAVAVLPPTVGDTDKLFLPDAVITELMAAGVHIVDRSTINQRLADNDVDLRRILDEEQYHRLHSEAGVDAVAIINSRLMGSGIGTATCRVIHFPSGEILSSLSYEQPGSHEQADEFEGITHTARKLAESIRNVTEAA